MTRVGRFSAAAMMLVLVACGAPEGAGPSPTSTAPVDAVFDHTRYSVVWTDSAGLNLMSPQGTYVRATVESLLISATNGRRDAAAPGFFDSVTDAVQPAVERFFSRGPVATEYGIWRYEVLDMTRNAEGATVTVCSYSDQVGHEQYDDQTGKPTGNYTYFGSSQGMSLTFAESGQAPPGDQRGPALSAHRSVFGDWRTTRWDISLTTENPCRGRTPSGLSPRTWPAAARDGKEYVTRDVPSEPNSPGWPDGSQA